MAALAASAADEAKVVIDRWAAALNSHDAVTVVKLYAPDATLLATLSPILADDPESIQKYFTRLADSGFKVRLGERRSVTLSDTAVMETGFYAFTAMQNGKPTPLPARFTFVVMKRGSNWMIVHHHSSWRPP